MKALVVYESMYGNTHLVADAIATGLRGAGLVVDVVPAHEADAELLADADLTVVGGPTHVHGMTRESTRKAAVDAAQKPGSDLAVDPDAEGPGLRDWFEVVGHLSKNAAAFDTRMDAPAVVTGRASKGISKRLRAHGCTVIVEPESFLVTKENHLLEDEESHARDWGARLAEAIGVRTA
jgi:menaquinone-dependent protoporphyrinogen IX oxidase